MAPAITRSSDLNERREAEALATFLTGSASVEPKTDESCHQNSSPTGTAIDEGPAVPSPEEEATVPRRAGQSPKRISHLFRPDLSPARRYGILAFVLATLALLLASDLGSGIQAITVTIPAATDRWSRPQEVVLADESIFSSVHQLWKQGSYPLAIFLAVASIAWPYVKLLLTIYVWVAPFEVPAEHLDDSECDQLASHQLRWTERYSGNCRRIACWRMTRERLIEWLDLLGKWSFADVLVFCQLVVAFRATVPVGAGTTLEVYMVALWGFYGFVVASMLGLIATHVILYHHRSLVYSTKLTPKETMTPTITNMKQGSSNHSSISLSTRYLLVAVLSLSLITYLVGCCLPIFEITRQRGDIETTSVQFSIVSIGSNYVGLTKDESGGDLWIQILWFFLTLVMPVVSTVLLCAVLLFPICNRFSALTCNCLLDSNGDQPSWLQNLYCISEVTYCWSCMEVTVLATLFAVLEIPKVGSGMVDSGCNVCYVIDSKLLVPAFVPLLVGSLVHWMAAISMFRKVHPFVYTGSSGTLTDAPGISDVENIETEEEVTVFRPAT